MQFLKVAFFVEPVAQKSQNTVVTHPSNPYFSSPFFKTFVTLPPNINELDTVVTPTPVLRPWHPKIWNAHLELGMRRVGVGWGRGGLSRLFYWWYMVILLCERGYS